MTSGSKERFPIPTPARLKAELRLGAPPFWMVSGLAILIALSFVPLAIIAQVRFSKKDKPRVHIFQDMGVQPKVLPQSASSVFVDGRGMRPPAPGTVARGMLAEDDHLERGFVRKANNQGGFEIEYFSGFPQQLTIDTRFVQRGQKLYSIYCATCHGVDGYGNGPVNQRAIEKEEPKWVPASNLHTEEIRGRVEGHLYNSIRNGIRNMPAYGSQIDVHDRWAIVAYVRALQRSQHATLEDVPAAERDKLR